MKYKVPVHVSMDLEVEVNGRKTPDIAELRQKAEELVEKKLRSVLGGTKIQGDGRAKATPTKARNEQGQMVFKQPKPRSATRPPQHPTPSYMPGGNPGTMPSPPDVDPPDFG
jgi:hypothetical protein